MRSTLSALPNLQQQIIKRGNETFKTISAHENKAPRIKNKPLEFFERMKRDYEGEKRSLKTALSTNSDVLRASYLVSYRIAKTKKPFIIGEELILPACTDICREV